MLPAEAHLDPRFKRLPEPARGRVPVDPGGADPRAREARGRAQRPHDASRASSRRREVDLLLAIAAQVAQSIEHAKLYADAQRRVVELEALARISEAVSESLYLEESLAGDREHDDGRARRDRRRARARRRRDRVAGGSRRRVRRAARRSAGAAGRSASSSATATRRSRDDERGSCSRRSPTTRRSRSSTGAPSCAACSPRRSTTGSRTTCRRSRRCCASRPGRPTASTRAKALDDSVNRILAIAAVHEVLTERRDDDVDLDDLLDRLRAMLVQGLGAGEGRSRRRVGLEPVVARRLARDGAGARLRGAAAERARARRRRRADRARPAQRRGSARDRRRRRRDRRRRPDGTGLSIVRALVRGRAQRDARPLDAAGYAPRSSFPA